MREVAERRQQLELEHEQALAILKFKQDEIKRLQRSKVRDLEEKCRSQSEQFGLLSQELEKFRLQASKVDLASSSLLSNPSLSVLANGVGLTTERGELKEPLLPEPGDGLMELNTHYNPYDGPNDNPEVELPLTAGEYIYVYGDMDDDGFYEGELMDGRRGLVPSNFTGDVSHNSLLDSSLHSASHQHHLHTGVITSERTGASAASGPPSVGVDIVPYPRKLTLIKQLAKSIIIGWDPPLVPAGWGNVWSYNVYVDQELRLSVPFGAQTKAVLERLDINLKAYRVSVQSMTEKGLSDQLRCSLLVGRDVSVAPTQLCVDRITATSANLTWLPSNSNYVHIVSLNDEECELVKAGCYSLCLNNLLPSRQYTVKVEARPHRTPWELPVERREHRSTTVTFTTLMAGPPDAPLDVQLEAGPSAGIALISWLPVTIDAAGTSNGVRVTGYTLYADKKKVLEVASPTAGSALLGPSQIQSLQAAQELTVRTMSAHGESCPAVATPVVPPLPCSSRAPSNLSPPPSYTNSAAKVSALPSDTRMPRLTVEGAANPPHALCSEDLLSSASYVKAWANPSDMEESTDLVSEDLSNAGSLSACCTSVMYQTVVGMGMSVFSLCVCVCVSLDESSKIKGEGGIRIFVALFPYDPVTMSPNPDAAEEELPFSEGQIIKVYGDKDADGFYRGESGGRLGYVPCNMVSEIQVEDEETRQQLLQQGFLPTAASMEKIGTWQGNRAVTTSGPRRMVAIFDYDPRESSPNTDIEAELTFSAGDIIHVFGDMDEDGFFYGDLNGHRGLVPSNFLQSIPDSAPTEPVCAQSAPEPRKESLVTSPVCPFNMHEYLNLLFVDFVLLFFFQIIDI
uniref:RIMS-binding protein 2 n=1 Tax=Kryptolebias marmoratus TaxID=37003 RepID=A0A3Q3ANB0_KRYMA